MVLQLFTDSKHRRKKLEDFLRISQVINKQNKTCTYTTKYSMKQKLLGCSRNVLITQNK